MEDLRNGYPNFVPNQVLSSGQLNALREYLDQQDRLSRIKLTGTGIVCGLAVERAGSNGPVHVSAGFGITSDGYLLGVSGGDFTHWRDYVDPGNDEDGKPAYGPWRELPGLNSQVKLLELLEAEQDPATDSPLTASQLNDRVVVLYLQVARRDLQSCLVTDCNNTGEDVLLEVKVLLARKQDLRALQACAPAPAPLLMPRLHRALALTEVTTTSELNKAYASIVEDGLSPLVAAIEEGFKRYFDVLGLTMGDIEPLEIFTGQVEHALSNREVNQYHYDLLVDLTAAYNEFIEAACRWVPDCSPPAVAHPRHLMLDHLQGDVGYRHLFRAAPTRSQFQDGLARTGQLLRRLLAMLGNVEFSTSRGVHIIPSHVEQELLGDRALPHYYKFSQQQLVLWHPDDCCTLGRPWGYDLDTQALHRDYRRCSLMRIEGHLEQGWTDARLNIAQLRRRFNAEFKLLVLYLDGPGRREREFLERLKEGRKKKAETEDSLIFLINENLEAERFRPNTFKNRFDETVSKLRNVAADEERLIREWLAVRHERDPLCDLGHLEADYGAARTQILCLLYRLSGALETKRNTRIPPMRNMDRAGRKDAIKEAAELVAELAESIHAESDETARRILIADKAAAESMKQALEAETSLLAVARKSTANAMVKKVRMAPDASDGEVAKVVEAVELMRAENAESSVQLAEQVSLEALRESIQALIDNLPKRLAEFDLDAFLGRFKQLVSDLIALRLMAYLKLLISIARVGSNTDAAESAVLKALSEGLRMEQQDLQQMLLAVIHDCRHSRLVYLYHLYAYHRQYDNSRFADFASRNPGMEHLAGVEKGGTFILVAEQEGPEAPVVADFALSGQVACCCDAPEELCLPPVAMPDYRIAYLRLAKDGETYRSVEFSIDVLANDYDPNLDGDPGKGYLRGVELLQETSELGAELLVDKFTGQVSYLLESPSPGVIDRFEYRLRVEGSDCAGEDTAQVLILLIPEIEPEPELGAIQGRVTWFGKGQQAQVQFEGSSRVATTDKDGYYRIDNLDPQSYRLFAVLWDGEVTSDPQMVNVVAGETAAADFNLPEDQESGIGNLHIKVTDARTGELLRTARTILLDAEEQPIASTNVLEPDGFYKLIGVREGTYKLVVGSKGYSPDITDLQLIQADATGIREIALVALNFGFIPSEAVEVVSVSEDVRDETAKTLIAKTYAERQAGYVKEIEAVAEDSTVANSEAFAKAEEFLTKTLQDPDLKEEEILEAYDGVSKAIAGSVARASEARKEEYRILLSSVSKGFMDRVTLENPLEVKPEAKLALEKMNSTVSGAGIDTEAMSASWKGDEFASSLGLRSSAGIETIVRRR